MYRSGAVIASVAREDSSKLVQKLMGEDSVKVVFKSSSRIDLQINDYVTVFGRNFYINVLPTERKESSRLFH